MKKIILLALVTLMMVGCREQTIPQEHIDEYLKEQMFVVDSCEYLNFGKSSSHKGNCRFCAERRKQELKELIEQLKEK